MGAHSEMNKDMHACYQLSCAEHEMGPKIKGFARLLILGMWSFSCVLRSPQMDTSASGSVSEEAAAAGSSVNENLDKEAA